MTMLPYIHYLSALDNVVNERTDLPSSNQSPTRREQMTRSELDRADRRIRCSCALVHSSHSITQISLCASPSQELRSRRHLDVIDRSNMGKQSTLGKFFELPKGTPPPAKQQADLKSMWAPKPVKEGKSSGSSSPSRMKVGSSSDKKREYRVATPDTVESPRLSLSVLLDHNQPLRPKSVIS
jgi:hypothetical protein